MKMRTLAALAAFAVTLPAHADEWTGDFELGFSNTGGNSRDTTLNTSFDVTHENERWHQDLFGAAYYARSDGDRTAERYSLGYKPRYLLNERDYVFGTLRYERDRFSDILHRWTEILGVGRRFIDTPTTELELEVGAGARQTRYDVNPDGLSGDEPIVYFGGKFEHDISDSAQFQQLVRVEYGDDNRYTESITGLKLSVTATISAKLTHTIRHNSDVVGVRGENTDRITGVNMVYSF